MGDDGYGTIRLPNWARDVLDDLVKEINRRGIDCLPAHVRARAEAYEHPTANGHVAGYAFLLATDVLAGAKTVSAVAAPPAAVAKRTRKAGT